MQEVIVQGGATFGASIVGDQEAKFDHPRGASMIEIVKHSRQRGATLVEIVLYLAVAAIVIFAVYSLFGSAFGSSKSQTETQNVQGLVASINNIYGTMKDYPSGNLVPNLIQAKAAPSSMVVPGVTNALRNAWGGSVVVNGIGDFYNISYSQVPTRACVELVRTPLNSFRQTVNGTAYAMPINGNDAAALCGSESNILIWDIR